MQTQQQIKRKQLMVAMAATVGLFLIVYLGMVWSSSDTPKTEISYKPKTDEISKNYALPTDAVKAEDKWQAQAAEAVASNNKKYEEMQQRLNELEAEKQAKTQELLRSSLPAADLHSNASQATVPPMPSFDNKVSHFPPLPPPPTSSQLPTQLPPPPNPVVTPPAVIEEIDLSDGGNMKPTKGLLANKDKEKENSLGKSVESFIPAGAFAKVVFLTGFDAPTGGQAQGNALPVVMRVKSFMTLPNKFKSNLKECFIIGNGYGDMASERAYIRIERLSCVLRDGKVIESKVKGHVAGEDASFGLRGKVVSKQGQLIAKSFFAGLFSGMGKNIADQHSIQQTSALGVVTTYDPNKTVESGIATGVATSASKIADFWLSQANAIFPIIEISAGRIGEVFLMEGADFGELKVAVNSNVGD
ncbi:MAG TPA: TraB/VirB10 family protein [Agitococcus sp.]|nr:TraB/VirB10 family protein [Agitococcus sp.]